MDFKKTFLKFTQWTIPHGYEETITHLLPNGLEKDEVGNYRIVIGESETLFTCHLDTVSTRMKINHIIQGDIIRTDGTTILGGDNKAGVCILMYLIEQNVPGTYYFFVGEETGCIGSRWALKNEPDYFRKFKRAIAFDRKKSGSIITKQRGSICASIDFAEALSKDYGKNGLQYRPDDTGVYTDTAVFMGIIPEFTNISAAVWGEHTRDEYVNIKLIEQIAHASAKINWEKLPTKRTPRDEEKEKKKITTYGNNYDEYGSGHTHYNSRNKSTSYQHNNTWQNTTKKDDDGIPVDGADLTFNVDNVPSFFELTKIQSHGDTDDKSEYFADKEGTIWMITINSDTVSIAKELQNGMPDIVYHESLKSNIPKNFNELWERIKDVVSLKRKKKKKKTQNAVIKETKRTVTLIVPPSVSFIKIQDIINDDSRIKAVELVRNGSAVSGDKKYFDIALVFDSSKPYEVVSNIVDSTIEKFKKQLGAIVSTKAGTVVGKFDNSGTQMNMFGKPLTIDNIVKVFDLKKAEVGEEGSLIFKERFEDKDGTIYNIEIDGNIVSVFLISSSNTKGQYKLLFHGAVKSWDELYDSIKDKVGFSKKDSEPLYNEKNFDKAFELVNINSDSKPGVSLKDSYRDVKGNVWTFTIQADGDTTIFLNRSSIASSGQGYFVIRINGIKSYDDFVKKIKESDRSVDSFDKTVLFNLIDTYKFKKSSVIDDEEEEEDDDDE